MKIFKSGIKVLGIIALICVLALSFSPSKALAAQTLKLTGTVDIVDDEVFGNEECLGLPIESEITLNEGESGNLIDFKKCCGEEVRAELFLDAFRSLNNFEVDGYAQLYGGTNCDTTDLEDEEGIGEIITPNKPLELDIPLKNGGAGGGDTADFDLLFTNN